MNGLISAEALADQLHQPHWRIFDCRHNLADPEAGRRAYGDGHIPGADFMHLDEDLSGPKTGRNGRHPLPDPQALAARLGAAGVGPDTQVVAYDADSGMFAARLWWMLRWLGHGRVAVLDGGLAAWQSAGLPLSCEPPVSVATTFEARPDSSRLLGVAEVVEQLHELHGRLLDARAPDRFAGQNETLDPVGGHIPGARNRFFMNNLAQGRFKPAEVLRAEFMALLTGQSPQQVVHSCGSGVTACHNLLAMEVAGLPGSRLYAGSWSEWCADPARPVAR